MENIGSFDPTFIRPSLFISGLAIQAIAIATKVIVRFRVATIQALKGIRARSTELAIRSDSKDFFLSVQLREAEDAMVHVEEIPSLICFKVVRMERLPSYRGN